MRSTLLPQSLNASTQVSVAFVTFILTVLLIFGLHLGNITKFLKEKIPFVIELSPTSTENDHNAVIKVLTELPIVKQSSIISQSKEEAFREILPQASLTAESENPFSDLIIFSIQSTGYDQETIKYLQSQIEGLPSVVGLLHQEQNFDLIKMNLSRLLMIGSILTGIFFLFALFFVIGSIRYSLHQERQRIKTMQIVGAKKTFIWQPLRKSTLQKTIKALVISDSIVLLIIIALVLLYPSVRDYISIIKVLIALLLTNCIMIFVVLITTFVELTRYLEVNFYELDEL